MNPGHATTFTKDKPRKPILPTRTEMVILRRIARSYAKLTLTEDGPQYAYADGTLISMSPGRFRRMVANHWLIGDKDSLLPDGSPQVYRARKP